MLSATQRFTYWRYFWEEDCQCSCRNSSERMAEMEDGVAWPLHAASQLRAADDAVPLMPVLPNAVTHNLPGASAGCPEDG